MQLSREAVKRMVGTGGEYSFVGGSGQQANMAGYASLSFVEENYVSKVFFARLFTVYDANGNAVIPNDADTAIDNIKAMVGLWTNQYMSALGQNSEGGGGGSSTLAGLLDVAIASPQTGQVLTYDETTGKWVNAAVPGGGGGTVTSVGLTSQATGLTVTGATITTSGTFVLSLASGYGIPTTAKQQAWDNAVSVSHTHSNKTSVLDKLTVTGGVLYFNNSQVAMASDIDDMATMTWVGQQSYATQSWVTTALSNYYTKSEADAKYMTIAAFENLFRALDSSNQKVSHPYSSSVASIKAMVGLWTEQYLSALGQNSSGGGGGASTLAGLVDVAIQSPQTGQVLMYDETTGKWVNAAAPGGGGGTVTAVTAGTGLSGGTITTSGTIAISSTYQEYIEQGTTAYGWGNHALAGYLTSVSFSDLTSHPDTLAGYGITDVKFGTQGVTSVPITLGSTTKTVLTAEVDPTVPAWAKAASKPSYSFSELTNHPTTLAGYGITDAYTKSEADAKYMTIVAFENLFRALDSSNQKVSHPYSSGVASIKAMVGLWTEQYLSALGLNSQGSGGAAALADLVDVAIASPQTGQVLTYDGVTGKWVNGAGGGGGGGTVTRVAMTVPTGFSVSGTPITSSGTLALSFSSGYSLPTTADQVNWDSAYIAKHTHSNKSTLDGITGTKVDNWDNAYNWVNTNSANVVMQSDISDMATKTWVGNQGFQTAGDVGSLMQNYAYISSGVIYIGNNSITPLTQHQTVSGTFWGQSWTNGGTVSGNISNAGYIFMSGNLVMNATGASDSGRGLMIEGYANSGTEHRVTLGLHEANSAGWVSSGITLQLVVDTSSTVAQRYIRAYDAIRIGDGMLMWDSTNNAFKVIKADGTAANLYATGGVSALGMSAGASSIDAMTFGTLNVTNTLKVKKGSYINDIYTNNSGKLYIESNAGTWIEGGLTVNDSDVEMSGESNLNMNGNRIYLTSGVYLYTDGTDVNVNINGTNYKLYKI